MGDVSFAQVVAEFNTRNRGLNQHDAYEDIKHPKLSSEPLLAPVEPTEEEQREFLGVLPDEDLGARLEKELSELCGGSIDTEPPVPLLGFKLWGSVSKVGQVSATIYYAFQAILHHGMPIASLLVEGQPAPFTQRDDKTILTCADGRLYISTPTAKYPWGSPEDTMVWVGKAKQPMGYMLNGWVFTKE